MADRPWWDIVGPLVDKASEPLARGTVRGAPVADPTFGAPRVLRGDGFTATLTDVQRVDEPNPRARLTPSQPAHDPALAAETLSFRADNRNQLERLRDRLLTGGYDMLDRASQPFLGFGQDQYQEPEPPPRDAGDFFSRTLPLSAARTIMNLPFLPINAGAGLVKGVIDTQQATDVARRRYGAANAAEAGGFPGDAQTLRRWAGQSRSDATRGLVNTAAQVGGVALGGAPGAVAGMLGGPELGTAVVEGPGAALEELKRRLLTDPASVALQAGALAHVPAMQKGARAAFEAVRPATPLSPQSAAEAARFGAGIDPQAGYRAWAQQMEGQFGRGVRKSLPEIWQTSEAIRSLGGRYDDLFSAVPDMAHWRDWYDRHLATLQEHFGQDAPQVLRFLAATSQAASVPSNVGLGIKAYQQWLGGQPFEGYLPAVKSNLERAATGQELAGPKISAFDRATRGDAEGVAVDRHLSRLFWSKDSPSTPAEYAAGVAVVKNMAAQLGWEPRQVQSALWALNQVRQGVPESRIGAYDTQILTPRNQRRLADIRARFANLDTADGAGAGRSVRSVGAAAGPVGADAPAGAAGAAGRATAGPTKGAQSTVGDVGVGGRPWWDIADSLNPQRIARTAQDIALAPLGMFLGAGSPGGVGRGGLFNENAAGAGGHSPDGGAGLSGGTGAAARGGDRGAQLPAGPAGATRIEHIAPEDLGILPGIQYKRGVNKEGVTDILSNQREYQVEFGDTLTAFRNADGKLYVVDGHHRRELARRSGRFTAPTAGGGRIDVERTLPVRVLDARDGWTEAGARAYGVLKNLRENKGVAIDAADALRAVLDEQSARGEATNLPKTPLARDTAGLVLLDEPGRAMVRSGSVRPSVAAGIGESLRGDVTRQRIALEEAAKSPGLQSYEDGLTLGRQVRDEAVHDAGDGGQGDLFGGDAGGTTFVSTAGKQTELLRSVRLQLAGEKSGLLRPVGADLLEGESINAGQRQEMAGKIKDAGDKFGAVTEYDPAVRQLVRDVAGQALRGEISDVEAQGRIRQAVIAAGEGATLAQIVARSSTAAPVSTPPPTPPKPIPVQTPAPQPIPQRTPPPAASVPQPPAPEKNATIPTPAPRIVPTVPTPASPADQAALAAFDAGARTQATLAKYRRVIEEAKATAPAGAKGPTPTTTWPSVATGPDRPLTASETRILADLRARRFDATSPQTSGKPADLSALKTRLMQGSDPLTGQGRLDMEVSPTPGKPKSAIDHLSEVLSVPRAVMTSFDFSGLGAQGGKLVVTHPIVALKALPAMVKANLSEHAYDQSRADLVTRQAERYGDREFYKKVGLDLSGLDGSREEAFGDPTLAEKIPGIGKGIRGSGRAYTTVLNELRAGAFDALYHPSMTQAELEGIAAYVNVASDRGDFRGPRMRAIKEAMPAAATALFSPRALVSRIQYLSGQPLIAAGGPKARAAIAREYIKYAAAVSTYIGLASASGLADVEKDPRSSDFGKVRWKGSHVESDPIGNLRSYIVLASRLATGETKGVDGVVKPGRDLRGTAHTFLDNKMAPVPAAAVNIATRKDTMGKPASLKTEALKMLAPMGVTEFVKGLIEEGTDPKTASQLALVLGLQTLGVGAQYRNRPKEAAAREKMPTSAAALRRQLMGESPAEQTRRLKRELMK